MDSLTPPATTPEELSNGSVSVQEDNGNPKNHRRNHRAGTKERARRERKVAGEGSTCGSPNGTEMSFSMGPRKKGRAGVKVRERRERRSAGSTFGEEDVGGDSVLDESILEDSILEDSILEETDHSILSTGQDKNDLAKNHNEQQEEPEDPPSLTYDSDSSPSDHETEIDEPHTLTPTLSSLNLINDEISVRTRADTGSFEATVEAEIQTFTPEVIKPELVQPAQPQLTQTLPTTPKSQLVDEPKSADKPRVKHEVKLLGLKRPEVLKGGEIKPLVPRVKHEVKLLSLMGTKKLKQGEII
ncbi:hypothetical protein GLAREA_08392 [Glarea lozoyensis ATCC 20868]|uniref:Uncharacterized protein n=1 Tax=Glarea lozoyensis (strain ATCC 20868 / MF5171) TaxID=1116229 RepID=S3CEX1_GLAL2|nr:uncharacterized protein GLAREA_08392 [Glarea lozoyensis ATCC 20868]EPE24540.1 hypothetical protein GLAREA_08392 [Glarea lozoyensis ATCC 20868]